jgi:hypothetical protein
VKKLDKCKRIIKKVKVKLSLYRSGQALRVPGGLGSQISRQSTHVGDKFVSLTAAFTIRRYSW